MVKHAFYEKDCASKMVMMGDLAVPHKTIITTLSQEVRRRMVNCCRSVNVKERVSILDTLMKKMKNSKHCQSVRLNVLECGLVGYFRMVEREKAGGIRVNRPAEDGVSQREMKKILGKVSWMREREEVKEEASKGGPKRRRIGGVSKLRTVENDKRRTEGIIFVPCTPKGALVKVMQKAEDNFSKAVGTPRVKMVEMCGRKLTQILIRKDPWAGKACERKKCLPCSSKEEKDHGMCQKENITYKIKCEGCAEVGKEATYIGESSRTMYQRGKEHSKALEDEDEESPLWTHCQVIHGGAPQEFSMTIIRSHVTAFDRQVSESVFITTNEADIIINRKSEWNGESIPRLLVEVKDEIEQVGYDGKKIEVKRMNSGTEKEVKKNKKTKTEAKTEKGVRMKKNDDVRDDEMKKNEVSEDTKEWVEVKNDNVEDIEDDRGKVNDNMENDEVKMNKMNEGWMKNENIESNGVKMNDNMENKSL